jgi:hypothetical protein
MSAILRFGLVVVVPLIAAAYAWLVRPGQMRWGATDAEIERSLPGDEIGSHAMRTTRAITIEAPVHEVWPWLVQMGQDRAGFYTHNWVERLLWAGIPDVHHVDPRWQRLDVGDLIRTAREYVPGRAIGWRVLAIDPERSLVTEMGWDGKGTWALVLDRTDHRTTRLISRDRETRPWFLKPLLAVTYDPLHAYMQIGVLQGVKRRAEWSHARGIIAAPVAGEAGAPVVA